MKKLYFLLLIPITAVLIFFGKEFFYFFHFKEIKSVAGLRYSNDKKNDNPADLINIGSFELKNEIFEAMNKVEPPIHEENAKAGIISHHLPIALPLITEFYNNLKSADKNIKTFIVMGPDHYEKCNFKAVTANLDFNTPFGILEIDEKGSKIFIGNGLKVDNDCFNGEHAIGVQATFIKFLFPDARIIPILFSSAAGSGESAGVLESIKKIGNVFIIGSVDFSHYQKLKMAEIYDNESRIWIEKNNPEKFNLSHIDSPATIKLILDYAHDNNLKPVINKSINSFAYTGQAENTTGYMSIFFK